MVIQENALIKAQQGDPDAIATLINQVISKKGMMATAKTKGNCLHIVIEADHIPDQASCLRFIQDGMTRLNARSIDFVRVYGRHRHEKWPSWTELLPLRMPVEPQLTSTQSQISTGVAPQPKRKSVKITTKYNKKIPLVLLGGICWILIAAVGLLVRIKMESKINNPSEQSTVQQLNSATLSTTKKPITKTPVKPQPTAKTTQKAGVPVPPKNLTNPTSKTQKLPVKTPPKPQPTANLNLPKNSPTPAPAATKPTPKVSAAPIENLPPLSPAKPPTENVTGYISIKAVGDIVPGTNFPNNRLPSNRKELFQNVKPYLQGADILFGNFESTLTNYPRTAKDTSRPMVHAFRTPPEYAKLLKETGFDVLSVANNHSMDFTAAGFEDTIKNIDQAGMKAVGKKNQIVYVNTKNTTIAFIGFSYLNAHNSMHDLAAGKALVAEAKKKATIVVISVHAGAEGTGAMRVKNKTETFYGENRGNLVLFSRTMIDSGADLILGHSPHVPRAMELYKGKLIAYSLGNFVGYRTLSTWGALGQSLILDLKLDTEGNFIDGKIIPVQLDRRGIPYIDKQFRSVQLIRNLTKGDFPNTNLKINSKGEINKE